VVSYYCLHILLNTYDVICDPNPSGPTVTLVLLRLLLLCFPQAPAKALSPKTQHSKLACIPNEISPGASMAGSILVV
jgi:hypothetical protein